MTELDDIRKRTEGHTPGPWVDKGLCTTAEYHWWSVQLPGNREVQVEGMTSQEAVSNCALIAAAPELRRITTEQEAELESLRGSLDEWKADYKAIESELTQLRTEVQRFEEAARELWQKQVDQLRAERERLLEYLGRIRPLAKSIALISDADQDVKDMADSIWTITLAALTQREGGDCDHQ